MGANVAFLSSEQDILLQWPDGRQTKSFNPFTDANDDYAVLEWMRSTDDKRFALGHGPYGYQCTYQIGDYARAALEALAA